MGDTKISWTMGDDGTPGRTWNPIRGCSRTIAAGAAQSGCGDQTGGGCYAERMAGRFCGPRHPYDGLVRITPKGARWTGEVRMVPEHLADPIRWKKPRRIFVNSMSDLFHEKLNNEQIAAVFGVMAAAPRHTFQVLTKRAKRMREWFTWVEQRAEHGKRLFPNDDREWRIHQLLNVAARRDGATETPPHHGGPWPLPNVWMGVSVENQAAANERIPELLRTPAAVRFLSCEPLIGAVDIGHWLDLCHKCHVLNDVTHEERHAASHGPALHWVIAGCESGPGARPCKVAWLRSLRNQCKEAGVAFFLKQAHNPPPTVLGFDDLCDGPGSRRKAGGLIELPYLDGVQHAAFPKVP